MQMYTGLHLPQSGLEIGRAGDLHLIIVRRDAVSHQLWKRSLTFLFLFLAQNEHCDLGVYPKLLAFTELAFPIRHDWVLKNAFRDAMVAMRREGEIQTLSRK